jgi:hypothetical protein
VKLPKRVAFFALACGTIAVGLVIHLHGAPLGPVVQDALGDALWATMIAWWAGVLAPRTRLLVRSLAAFVICLAVEISQLYHTTALDAVRGTTLGHLVLGSGFNPRDLVAYAAGVTLAALLESTYTELSRIG